MNMQPYRSPAGQRGLVMISALLLLLVATILAATMFRSFGTQEKIAGNLREKERAVHAAVTAQQYAEWWLQSGNAPAKGNCASIIDYTAGQVCSNAIPTTDIPNPSAWPGGVTFAPPDPSSTTSRTNMDVTQTIGPGTYWSKPTFYIADLGPGAGGELYQIDAWAVGGTANTVAVVESTYVLTSSGHCADPLLGC
jgi:type IV pilus assembly protein PilX